MKHIIVFCSESETSAEADVLDYSDKRIRAVFKETTMEITLTRKDTRHAYTGTLAGLNFETTGETND